LRTPSLIGLTGGIAAGKSEALRAFERLGAETISTDQVVRGLLRTPEVRGRLVDRWGDAIAPDGELDRAKVAEIVFESPEELRWLESELHPLVGGRVIEWAGGLPADATIAVVEVPLLFESGMDELFDAVVSVVAPDDVRAGREQGRGLAALEGRSARQLSQDEKAARDPCDHERRQPRRPRGEGRRADRGSDRGREVVTTTVDRRRRILAVAGAIAAGVVIGLLLTRLDTFEEAIREVTLPLRHDDIIRQQADEKDVPADLIAAVIYAESKFRDQTSAAGARGLMQITPETANVIERLSGGQTFVIEDLADPDINIRYGTFYLRYLLDRYDGNEVAALAAYNAGEAHVDEWGGAELDVEDIAFQETRDYVEEVLAKRDEYRDHYEEELGL